MIPILFDKSETAFKTNGLGRLSDALSCEVTEERNGSYELEMTYPVDGIHFSDIAYGRIVYAEPAEGEEPQPFEIYLITKPLNQIVTIHAEHISYRLKYIPATRFEANGVIEALSKLKSHSVIPCPFNIWTDKNAPGYFTIDKADSIRSFLTDGDDTITSVFGGEWKFDKFDAKLCMARGTDNGVTIRYGKNLTTLEQEENIENMVTGIYPYWTGQGDNDTDIYLELPEKVVNTTAANLFPYQRVIAVDFSSNLEEQEITHNWTETKQEVDPSTSRVKTSTEEKSETIKVAPTTDSLRQQARIYIEENNIGVPEVNLKVSFVNLAKSLEYSDIEELERVHLCDTVTVIFEKLGVSTKAKVTKTVYDVLNEKFTSIEVGNPKDNLTSMTKKEVKKSEEKTSQTIADTKNEINKNINTVNKDLGLKITKTENSLTSQAKAIKDLGDTQTTMQTSINQNATNIELKASKGDIVSEINQSAEGIKINAEKIDLSGFVTVTSLQSGGTTTIDGSRITTGTISADRIEGVSMSKIITGDNYRVVSEKSFEGNGSDAFQKCFDSNMKRYSINTDTLDNVRDRLRRLEAK